jgi:hypothetical protein
MLKFIEDHFQDAISEGENLLEQGIMSYRHLWTLFRPGDYIYTTKLGRPRIYELTQYNIECGMCPGLRLYVKHVDFDGHNFGWRTESLFISEYEGTEGVPNLNAFPLKYHTDEKDIRAFLTERGRHWFSHAGQSFCEYRGVAIEGRDRYNIDGRVMMDTRTFHRINANLAFAVNPFLQPAANRKKRPCNDDMELVPPEPSSLPQLTDEQYMLATPMLRGFSFTEKKFLDLFVDKTQPINWNVKCFDQLVLPESQKELVQALVAEHTARSTDPSIAAFDDIVKGKGRGLILVLHGPPGVGKTLTAECVAEFSHRPLYIVSSGDLGTSSTKLDAILSRTLDLASTWKAVLLIDEADVFLERRSLHDLERNSLVSIFLRTLEYYSGILFMTTNRVRTFDDAFKSRIHVPLRYDDLPRESRLKVWRNFLDRIEGGVDIDGAGYDALSEGKLNGRQIKNIVRTAKSLAAHKKRKLDCQQLQQVMAIQMAFEEELNGATSEE